jgi:hypothetical protein
MTGKGKGGEQSPPRGGGGGDNMAFPEWVPEIAVETIRELLATDYFKDHDEHRAAMLRLALDERMKLVWDELSRRERQGSRAPLHPMKVYPEWEKALRPAGIDPNTQASRVLLVYLANFLRTNGRVITKGALRAEIQCFEKTASECRMLAAAGDQTQDWIAWAEHWESEAKDLKRQKRKVKLIERQRLPTEVLAAIRGALLTTTELFGTPMHRTAATLASVIANHPVNQQSVQKQAQILK